jgi:hypothetical protein
MKRFLFFWFALTLVGLLVLIGLSRQAIRVHAPVMDEQFRGPDGRVHKAYLDRHGRVIALAGALDEEDRDGGEDEDDGRAFRREPAEGLPVPVVPGTRTTEARAEVPSPSRPAPHRPRTHPRRPPTTTPGRSGPFEFRVSPGLTSVTGRLSANEERARDDARHKFERLLAERLAPDVPRTWEVPRELVDGMIRQTIIAPRERDYGTVYEATLKVDLSPSKIAEVVEVYRREQVVRRLVALGVLLVFVLVCLAAVSGYINADEATKGYYTTRLRMAAAAGVAAAGVVLYRMLA